MNENNNTFTQLIYLIISIMTGMIRYHMSPDLFWAIVDALFFPLVWIKWLICAEINLTIIKETFSFFMK